MIPITLTDAAKSRLSELTHADEGSAGILLRIAQNKGCGGNEYRMERVDAPPAGCDRIEVGEGVALFIPLSDSFMMFGMSIDFAEDDVGNKKFIFTNPNETARCGCGESFSIN